MVTILFGLATWLLFRMRMHVGVLPLFYPLFAVTYAITAVFAGRLDRIRDTSFFAYSQFLLDVLCITVVVAFTGSGESLYSFFYIFVILGAGLILSTRGALLVASMVTVFYLSVLALPMLGFESLRSGIEPLDSSEGPGFLFRVSQVTVQLMGFYLVAWLSGTLSERLRESQQALRRAGVDLAALRELHANIIENIGSGILTLNEDGQISSFNRAARRITGLDTQDALELPITTLFPGIADFLEFSQTGATTGEAAPSWIADGHSWEASVKLPNSERRFLRFAVSPLRNRQGIPVGKVVTFEDRTRVRGMEERLERARHMADVGKLAQGIVHEIRNPLAAISGSAELLGTDAEIEESDRRLTQIIVREADRLNGLVSNFLGVARRRPLEKAPVRVDECISETLALLRKNGHTHPDLKIDEEFSYTPEILADRDRIKQVFWNLINNAFQAMPNGGVLRIRGERIVSSSPNNYEMLRVTVSDSGKGMTEEVRKRVFDPFFTRRSGGTGLGLAISQQIIEDHQGHIEVESVEGRGTTFEVLFPVRLREGHDGVNIATVEMDV